MNADTDTAASFPHTGRTHKTNGFLDEAAPGQGWDWFSAAALDEISDAYYSKLAWMCSPWETSAYTEWTEINECPSVSHPPRCSWLVIRVWQAGFRNSPDWCDGWTTRQLLKISLFTASITRHSPINCLHVNLLHHYVPTQEKECTYMLVSPWPQLSIQQCNFQWLVTVAALSSPFFYGHYLGKDECFSPVRIVQRIKEKES